METLGSGELLSKNVYMYFFVKRETERERERELAVWREHFPFRVYFKRKEITTLLEKSFRLELTPFRSSLGHTNVRGMSDKLIPS